MSASSDDSYKLGNAMTIAIVMHRAYFMIALDYTYNAVMLNYRRLHCSAYLPGHMSTITLHKRSVVLARSIYCTHEM